MEKCRLCTCGNVGCQVVTTKHILFKGIHENISIAGGHFRPQCCASNMKKMVLVELKIVMCEHEMFEISSIRCSGKCLVFQKSLQAHIPPPHVGC